MKNFIITEEIAKEYKIPFNQMERIFIYTTYEDMKNHLEELGYINISELNMEQLEEMITYKFEDDALGRMVSYLEYRGMLKK